ncbi:MAG: ferrochelatase [Burkholderiales bacterium]|jgi:ferrochelatase|nr:ferrochelatase [Burkholderiales bacterium]
MGFAPEPPHAHDAAAKLGVLLVNLGTPAAPTTAAVRRYLAEFLSDRRVVEIPPAIWQPILQGVVLTTRPQASAKKYAKIWTKDGSPLALHSVRQRSLLMGMLGQRMKREGLPADHAQVELAMRYGEPSISAAIDRLRAAGATKLLVIPLYPQYSSSATASVLDAVAAHLATLRRAPALRFVDSFHDDAGYVKACAQNVNDYWTKHGRPEHLVLSFHGVPRRTLDRGDPYHCQCHATSRLVARELGLEARQWTIAFQSRFGRAEWLKPYTADVLATLGAAKLSRVDVFCPGFVSDCLETLEEIGIEGRATFRKAGGGDLHAIPCLNTHSRWIAALADLAWKNLAGWLDPVPSAEERELRLARAKALGAKR